MILAQRAKRILKRRPAGQGRLTTLIDPLGNSSTRTYDAVSRLLTQTDPRRKATTFAYDALNRLTNLADPRGGVTRFTYDGNGNLLTVTDALSHTITHTYDSMDRLATRTDPLGRAETFSYDAAGNLTNTTDRKSQTTQFEYDPLNRRAKSTFADGTSSSFTYDAAGRLAQADDSADPHRPITLSYDTLDRLVNETTGLGSVSYQYDVLGRRTQMQVNALSPVSYTYDAASRLRTITQAPLSPVDIQYDAVGRRAKLTLPNGVSTEYQYDAASSLTALIYRHAAGILGDLTYTYDATGNRTGVGGSFARLLLPDPVASATYDAANQQLTFGDKTMTYDANGNLTAITDPSGVTTFTWDGRNRLVNLHSPGATAAFAYDAMGRRSAKQINGGTWAYQYDGADLTRVVNGASELTYLSDLRIDELLFRSDRMGLLTDGLGSILALTNSDGTPMTQYSYGPFGASQAEGVPDANPFQFTGRENDGTGLVFFRARYYSPMLSRFLSEDPMTLDRNTSLYAYVRNAPMRFVDPFGLEPMGPNGKLYYGPWQHYGEPGWFHVYATQEGLVGEKTATGHVIADTDVFAALPSRQALNRTVELDYNGKTIVAPVWEVGPWSIDDPYWEGNGVPKALLGERTKRLQDLYGPPKNPAGIDLSNQAFRNLGLKDNAWVWWRFANNPTQSFPSGTGVDRLGGRK